MKLLNSTVLDRRLCLILIALAPLVACSNDDGREATTLIPCETDTADTLYGSWLLPPNDVPYVHRYCIDTLCQYFNLELTSNQTYILDYQILDDNFSPPAAISHNENGTFNYNCNEEGFNTRLHAFHFFHGNLQLQPQNNPAYSLGANWSGFDGLNLQFPLTDGSTISLKLVKE
ncbi:MAG: hypothetical protein AAF433_15490 [Bacteroidota bacterium]